MTDEEIQTNCKQIYHFIHYELSEWIDSNIFNQNTFEELGKLYYQHILNQLDFACNDLINRVVEVDAVRTYAFDKQEDYYVALCEILNLKAVPSKIFPFVQQKFNTIYVQLYNQVQQNYIAEINKINNQLHACKQQSDSIKRATPSFSFNRDLFSDEDALLNTYSNCNALRTRKEMLEFGRNYVDAKLSEFCDLDDPQKISDTLYLKTLDLCKESMTPNADFLFSPYKSYLDLFQDDIARPHLIFYKIKVYTIIDNAQDYYRKLCCTKDDNEAVLEYKNYLSKIPSFDRLNQQKNTSPSDYNDALMNIILDYNLIHELKENINNSVTLRHRKNLLFKAISLYEEKEYDLFNNLIPIQIEGAFADFLTDATTFVRFTHMDIYANAVLKDKIKLLEDHNCDIYPEAIEYFKFYFNNLIRNRIAHGKYNISSDAISLEASIFAHELLLDLCTLVHMIIRRCETEKMFRFVHEYKTYYGRFAKGDENFVFEPLLKDMTGGKTTFTFDIIESYRPLQVAYWLLNPYYEKIYSQVADISELLSLRSDFLSKDFWEFVLKRLDQIVSAGWDYMFISNEFLSVVNGMFKCNISSDTKKILGKVHAKLVKIKAFH